jgi:SAM-dependent methyltransferase
VSSFFPATGMPDREWWGALWPDPEGLLVTLGAPRGVAAVDLCCGDGYFTAPMSCFARPSNAYAVDLDAELIGRARRYVAERGEADLVQFAAVDALCLTHHMPEPVGFVLLANTFHGVPDKPALAREVNKVLVPGGKFAVVNWHPAPREETVVLGEPRGPATELRISPEQTKAQVESAGFLLEKVADLPPYHYGAVFVRPR